jgi:hypothetical protein
MTRTSKNRGKSKRVEIECFSGEKVQTHSPNLTIGDGWTAFMEKVL